MAAIGTLYPTVVDLAKRQDPNGGIASVVESLAKKNPLLMDLAMKECNNGTGHRVTNRTALPTPKWRKFNQGVDSTKSETEQADETVGMLTAFSKVDVKLAKLNGNEAAFRASEDKAFVQAFNIEINRALIYESTKTNAERMHGLTPRLDYTSGNSASAQIIKADASASGNDQTSIWLVGWGEHTVYGIYPKGLPVGLQTEDLGKQLVDDSAGKKFTAYVTEFNWNFGLCVEDSRYLARVCNIDTSAWKRDAATGANIVESMMDAYNALFDMESVQPVYYMNRAAFLMFQKQLKNSSSGNDYLAFVERGGRMIPHFLGVPIRVSDSLTSTESVVS